MWLPVACNYISYLVGEVGVQRPLFDGEGEAGEGQLAVEG